MMTEEFENEKTGEKVEGITIIVEGITIEINVKPGTTDSLKDIGVRNASNLSKSVYPEMPVVSKGWMGNNAFFKAEGSQINIGLDGGKALDIFNQNIEFFSLTGGGSKI